jgi:hypothetical protein
MLDTLAAYNTLVVRFNIEYSFHDANRLSTEAFRFLIQIYGRLPCVIVSLRGF